MNYATVEARAVVHETLTEPVIAASIVYLPVRHDTSLSMVGQTDTFLMPSEIILLMR